ncbi:hypothetical protein EV697_101361 [Bisgaardia hudsonensis]|uniref:Uncharacterized protein n=1 Tax=Bisgaardia hudsonensis TaxID=109472 RepID=A0A4R2N2T4_9PAST|nr:hypothetical protein [Bisgaardia hudsonensis]TCP14224.1 hypothetical protein EV697_101361 [Bisgaardia hudsonensis]
MSEKFIKLNVNDENLVAKVLDIRELGHHVEISQSDYFKYTAAKNITAASFHKP